MASFKRIRGKWRAQLGPKHGRISKTFRTKPLAEKWAFGIEHGNESNANVPVKDLIQAYRDARAESGKPIRTKSNEDYMLRHLSEGLGQHVAMDLDTGKLLKWAQGRIKDGGGPVALNMELSKLGTVLRHTASLKNLRLPDIVGHARPTLQHYGLIAEAKKRKRRPSPDEFARICRWFREHPEYEVPMEDIIGVLRQSILRRGEIFRIEWGDLDEQSRGVIVRNRKHPRQQQGNDEFVLLAGDAWDIVQRQPRQSARIFPHEPGTASKYFKWACDACGIENLHLHDLKREATSTLAELGLSPQEVTAAGGPKKWEVQQIYTEIDRQKLNSKVVRLKTGS